MSVKSLSNALVLRIPPFPIVNRWFALALASLPAALGSATTFLLHGGAMWAALQLITGRRRLSRDPIMIAVTICLYVYAAVAVGSTIANGGANYWEELPSVIGFLGFPMGYSIWVISRKKDITDAVIAGSAISCVAALVLAFTQVYLLQMRAEGGSGNAIVFATVTSLSTSLVLAGMLDRQRQFSVPLTICFICGLVAVILSGSRLAWLALALAVLVILIVHRRSLTRRMSARAVGATLIVAILVVVVTFDPLRDRIWALWVDWQTLMAKGDYATSLGSRVALWQIGLQLFEQKPFIGHGLAGSERLIAAAFQQQFGLEKSYTHFHNGFLTAAVETGLLGLVALVVMFIILIAAGIWTLATANTSPEMFGGLIMLVTAIVYITTGMGNLMFGHDILDTMFLFLVATGIFLGTGRSVAPAEDA